MRANLASSRAPAALAAHGSGAEWPASERASVGKQRASKRAGRRTNKRAGEQTSELARKRSSAPIGRLAAKPMIDCRARKLNSAGSADTTRRPLGASQPVWHAGVGVGTQACRRRRRRSRRNSPAPSSCRKQTSRSCRVVSYARPNGANGRLMGLQYQLQLGGVLAANRAPIKFKAADWLVRLTTTTTTTLPMSSGREFAPRARQLLSPSGAQL